MQGEGHCDPPAPLPFKNPKFTRFLWVSHPNYQMTFTKRIFWGACKKNEYSWIRVISFLNRSLYICFYSAERIKLGGGGGIKPLWTRNLKKMSVWSCGLFLGIYLVPSALPPRKDRNSIQILGSNWIRSGYYIWKDHWIPNLITWIYISYLIPAF